MKQKTVRMNVHTAFSGIRLTDLPRGENGRCFLVNTAELLRHSSPRMCVMFAGTLVQLSRWRRMNSGLGVLQHVIPVVHSNWLMMCTSTLSPV